MRYQYNDGGRSDAGYKGDAGDCVVRAIAIATEQSYQKVYDDLKEFNVEFAKGRSRAAKKVADRGPSPRDGNFKEAYAKYLKSLGWDWKATCRPGQKWRLHLDPYELPEGRIICKVSRHAVAAIGSIVQDTYDCTRDGTRMVYGYYHKAEDNQDNYLKWLAG